MNQLVHSLDAFTPSRIKYEVTDLGSALKMFAALLIPAEKGPM